MASIETGFAVGGQVLIAGKDGDERSDLRPAFQPVNFLFPTDLAVLKAVTANPFVMR